MKTERDASIDQLVQETMFNIVLAINDARFDMTKAECSQENDNAIIKVGKRTFEVRLWEIL